LGIETLANDLVAEERARIAVASDVLMRKLMFELWKAQVHGPIELARPVAQLVRRTEVLK
jgi:hypothetical protein